MVPAAVGGGVLQPSINSMITKNVSSEDVGGILGISASFFSGANAITPLILGAIFELFGSTAPFLIGGGILLALWLISSRALPKKDNL
jgi:MFS family permease